MTSPALPTPEHPGTTAEQKPAGVQNTDPTHPERVTAVSPGGTLSWTPEQQDAIATLVKERLDRQANAAAEKAKAEAERTLEERIAAIEAQSRTQVEAAQRTAALAVAERAAQAIGAHDPSDLAERIPAEVLASGDAAAIELAVRQIAEAKPYFLASGTPAPTATPVPGAASTSGRGAKLMTAGEMEAVSIEQLASDPELRKLYEASRAAMLGA